MTTLYCASKSGKTKQWTVHTEGPEIVVTSGYVDGKLQEHRVLAVGKNIGKANETTPEQQALLEAQSKWNKKKDEGYEGSIIRNVDGKYEASFRSHDLIKYKDWYDAEFLIVGVKEGKGKFKGCAIYTCQVRSNLFDCTSPGTLEEKKEAWNNRESAIGKSLTVKYQEFTKEGIPRFPTAVAIRDYE